MRHDDRGKDAKRKSQPSGWSVCLFVLTSHSEAEGRQERSCECTHSLKQLESCAAGFAGFLSSKRESALLHRALEQEAAPFCRSDRFSGFKVCGADGDRTTATTPVSLQTRVRCKLELSATEGISLEFCHLRQKVLLGSRIAIHCAPR